MFTLPFSRKYSTLSDIEDTEEFLPKIENTEIYPTSPKSSWTPYNVFISLVLISLATCLGFTLGQSFPTNLDSTCTRHTSKYSPILDEKIISYDIVKYDGRFMEENIFRQDGSPEVDAAWNSLGGSYRPIQLSADAAYKAGLTENYVHNKPEAGGGYSVFMEGLHHIHCLDLVRQSLWYNYDYYSNQGAEAFGDSPRVLKWHVSHCVDILRQRLMCTVDTSVLGSVWVNRTNPFPFVDFNTNHVCKNFDAIRDWAERNQVPEEFRPEDLEMPGEETFVWESIP